MAIDHRIRVAVLAAFFFVQYTSARRISQEPLDTELEKQQNVIKAEVVAAAPPPGRPRQGPILASLAESKATQALGQCADVVGAKRPMRPDAHHNCKCGRKTALVNGVPMKVKVHCGKSKIAERKFLLHTIRCKHTPACRPSSEPEWTPWVCRYMVGFFNSWGIVAAAFGRFMDSEVYRGISKDVISLIGAVPVALSSANNFVSQFGMIGLTASVLSAAKFLICGGEECAGIHTLVSVVLAFLGASMVAILPLGGHIAGNLFGEKATLGSIQGVTNVMIQVFVNRYGGKLCEWRSKLDGAAEAKEEVGLCLTCALMDIDEEDFDAAQHSAMKTIANGNTGDFKPSDVKFVEDHKRQILIAVRTAAFGGKARQIELANIMSQEDDLWGDITDAEWSALEAGIADDLKKYKDEDEGEIRQMTEFDLGCKGPQCRDLSEADLELPLSTRCSTAVSGATRAKKPNGQHECKCYNKKSKGMMVKVLCGKTEIAPRKFLISEIKCHVRPQCGASSEPVWKPWVCRYLYGFLSAWGLLAPMFGRFLDAVIYGGLMAEVLSIFGATIPALNSALAFGGHFGIIGLYTGVVESTRWLLCGGNNCSGVHGLLSIILAFFGATLVAMLPLGGVIATGAFGAGASLGVMQGITNTLLQVLFNKYGMKFCEWRQKMAEEEEASKLCLACAMNEIDESEFDAASRSARRTLAGNKPSGGLTSADLDTLEKNKGKAMQAIRDAGRQDGMARKIELGTYVDREESKVKDDITDDEWNQVKVKIEEHLDKYGEEDRGEIKALMKVDPTCKGPKCADLSENDVEQPLMQRCATAAFGAVRAHKPNKKHECKCYQKTKTDEDGNSWKVKVMCGKHEIAGRKFFIKDLYCPLGRPVCAASHEPAWKPWVCRYLEGVLNAFDMIAGPIYRFMDTLDYGEKLSAVLELLNLDFPLLDMFMETGGGMTGPIMDTVGQLEMAKFILCGGPQCAGFMSIILMVFGMFTGVLIAMLPLGALLASTTLTAGLSVAGAQAIANILMNAWLENLGDSVCEWWAERQEEKEEANRAMCLSCAFADADEESVAGAIIVAKKSAAKGKGAGLTEKDIEMMEADKGKLAQAVRDSARPGGASEKIKMEGAVGHGRDVHEQYSNDEEWDSAREHIAGHLERYDHEDNGQIEKLRVWNPRKGQNLMEAEVEEGQKVKLPYDDVDDCTEDADGNVDCDEEAEEDPNDTDAPIDNCWYCLHW